jgi:hypothetical protein
MELEKKQIAFKTLTDRVIHPTKDEAALIYNLLVENAGTADHTNFVSHMQMGNVIEAVGQGCMQWAESQARLRPLQANQIINETLCSAIASGVQIGLLLAEIVKERKLVVV